MTMKAVTAAAAATAAIGSTAATVKWTKNVAVNLLIIRRL